MRIFFSGQVPKDFNFPESTEDAFEIDKTLSRVALSDGASESFDSRSWAQLLVKAFIANPAINIDWVSDATDIYLSNHNFELLSWSKQAAFERGSYATLIGIEYFDDHGTLDVFSVGDSLAILLSGNDYIDSFPYKTADEFKQRPTLLCTRKENNRFIQESHFYSSHIKTWDINDVPSPRVLCMTDALAEWSLMMASRGNPQWEQLLTIKNNSELQTIVESEREKLLMRVDDVTLISIVFS